MDTQGSQHRVAYVASTQDVCNYVITIISLALTLFFLHGRTIGHVRITKISKMVSPLCLQAFLTAACPCTPDFCTVISFY